MPLPALLKDSQCPVRRFGLPTGPEPDTVFLHGVLCSTAMWKRVAIAEPERRSIALPLPGHYPWRMTPGETARALDEFAFLEAYRDAILKSAQTPVQIVAHSTGALVALKFAATFPDMVKRLVLAGAFANGRSAVGQSSMALVVLLPMIGSSLFDGLWRYWLYSPDTFLRGLSTAKAASAKAAGKGHTGREADMLRDLRRSHPESLRRVVDWLSRTSVEDDLSAVEAPVTVLVSQHDPIVGAQSQLKLATSLPNATAVVCRSGHLPMLEQPDLVRRVVFRSAQHNFTRAA